MEQSVNTFFKGLQKDTHPMIQGNDTLSDALNATFVTMNGNEIILQNDMGNRRVDNAFLPAGYEPVGIKEYGGVIYVAAYNPITNRSQIGSFPSPERKINNLDNPDLGTTFYFDNFTSGNNVYSENLSGYNLSFIKNDTLLYSLTSDTYLHAGDKFVVHSNYIWQNRSRISFFDNRDWIRKNQYTLYIGIMNSQNEFVDFTKNLVRWDSNGNIINTIGMSDDEKFTTGYFIAPFYSNPNFDYTKKDAELIKERQTIAANTYSYKLVGPMYFKAELNHIENFNYNIYGTFNGETATLWIEASIEYNCPISNYFDFYPSYGYSVVESSDISYDQKTGLFSTKIVRKYEGIRGDSNNLLQYVIAVPAIGNYYLRGLTTEGVLDLSLLGSGEVKLNGWRFFNKVSQKTSLLTFMMDAYPEYGDRFSNLKLTFVDSNDNSKVFEYPRNYSMDVYNGRTNLTLDWNEIGLEERKLYKVTISYTSQLYGEVTLDSEKWLLTTELFNNCYDQNSGTFVKDYCEAANEDSDKATEEEKNIIKSYLQFQIGFKSNLVNNNKPKKGYDITGNLMSTGQSNIDVRYKYEYDVNLIDTPAVYIINEELYPDYIQIPSSEELNTKIKTAEITKVGSLAKSDTQSYNQLFQNAVNMTKYVNDDQHQISGLDNLTYLTVPTFTISQSNLVSGELFHYDIYKSKGIIGGEINNAFTSIKKSNVLKLLFTDLVSTKHFGQVTLDYDSRTGPDDYHYVDYLAGRYEQVPSFMKTDGEVGNIDNSQFFASECTEITYDKKDGKIIFNMSSIKEEISSAFSQSLPKEQVFSYLFSRDTSQGISNSDVRTRPSMLSNRYSRVWWRAKNEQWALFSKVWDKQTYSTFEAYLASIFTTEFYFCAYKKTTCSEQNIFVPTKTEYYNKIYNIPLTLQLEYSHNNPENIENSLNQVQQNKPIIFKFDSEEYSNNTNDIIIPLSSSDTFENMAENANNLNLTNICIDNGATQDANNVDLSPNSIYKINSEGKLEIWAESPVQIYQTDQGNTLIYNKISPSSLSSNNYDSTGWGEDGLTLLKYDQVILVPGVI